ncbi:hypothetical protein TWF102_007149 [Orbilia oligospora]|uniref:Uncharacterized protein n=1 Tax=Orbilia oligospora TaxID=2813651 RepID=A0A7C8JIR4_ORBOL|nr:hypothetical protein TWF706_007450 [Orbilia oligospora]KAF3111486.1 hypothetical protein TWF102_007149 [Orbilia oligospora]KAF3117313.1 hypothetical protein TWF103_007454 [Orbilia oligospora]
MAYESCRFRATENPGARGYGDTVKLIRKELSKLCNELVDITGRYDRMLSWITFELVRKAIIRGEIELLELWKNFATEIDLRPMCSCKRYAFDVMHDAIRHTNK